MKQIYACRLTKPSFPQQDCYGPKLLETKKEYRKITQIIYKLIIVMKMEYIPKQDLY
jgi:hypothetical protein